MYHTADGIDCISETIDRVFDFDYYHLAPQLTGQGKRRHRLKEALLPGSTQ
jgi:hypothetical protein